MSNSVVIYPTPEVTEMIKLLRPDAIVQPYGDGGNVAVSLPKSSFFEQQDFDCYEMAKQWNCTPEKAAERMSAEGWRFVEYDAIYGTERFAKKDK